MTKPPPPAAVTLLYNLPNPFEKSTEICYVLNQARHVRLKVFDAQGREVADLVNKRQRPGKYAVRFQPRSKTGGFYYYTINAEGTKLTGKMLLLE